MRTEAILLCLAALAAPPAAASENALPSEEVGFSIQLEASTSLPRRGHLAFDRFAGGGGSLLRPGDSGGGFLSIVFANGNGYHAGSVGGGEQGERRGDFVWESRWTLLEVGADSHRIRFDWTRYRRDGTDYPVDARGSGEGLLGDGETVVIDTLGLEIPGEYRQHVVLALRLSRRVPDAMSGRRYEVDAWATHRAPDGERSTHSRSRVPAGEWITLRPDPLRFPTGLSFRSGRELDGIVELGARLRILPLSDGRLEVELQGTRNVDAQARGIHRSGGFGDGGARRYIVKPGDTVDLVFRRPVYFGTSSQRDPDSPDAEDWAAFDFRQAYAERQDRLTIRIRDASAEPTPIHRP